MLVHHMAGEQYWCFDTYRELPFILTFQLKSAESTKNNFLSINNRRFYCVHKCFYNDWNFGSVNTCFSTISFITSTFLIFVILSLRFIKICRSLPDISILPVIDLYFRISNTNLCKFSDWCIFASIN